MITVISGTNRKGNKTRIFADKIVELLREESQESVHLIALEDLTSNWVSNLMYQPEEMSPEIRQLQDDYIFPAKKIMWVMPEYNGGIPGATKLFLDAISIREYPKNFKGKKMAMMGVASGRAGNLRGMDQLTGILMHVGATVMPQKLPISSIGKLLENDQITDEGTIEAMRKHAQAFLMF